MHTRRRWLIATNLGLAALIALAARTVPALGLQPASRTRGQYTMVAGELRGGTPSGIFLIDSINEEIVVLRWNESHNQLDGLDYRDLEVDAARQGDR